MFCVRKQRNSGKRKNDTDAILVDDDQLRVNCGTFFCRYSEDGELICMKAGGGQRTDSGVQRKAR